MDKATVDARFRVISILWGSLFAGVTLFTGVVWTLGSGLLGAPSSATLPPGLASKLLILSPVLMGVGIAHRNGEMGSHAAPEGYAAAYHARVLVALALEEAGAFLGLTLCLLAARPMWALGVWGIAAAAMFLSRPRRDDLHRIVR